MTYVCETCKNLVLDFIRTERNVADQKEQYEKEDYAAFLRKDLNFQKDSFPYYPLHDGIDLDDTRIAHAIYCLLWGESLESKGKAKKPA